MFFFHLWSSYIALWYWNEYLKPLVRLQFIIDNIFCIAHKLPDPASIVWGYILIPSFLTIITFKIFIIMEKISVINCSYLLIYQSPHIYSCRNLYDFSYYTPKTKIKKQLIHNPSKAGTKTSLGLEWWHKPLDWMQGPNYTLFIPSKMGVYDNIISFLHWVYRAQ